MLLVVYFILVCDMELIAPVLENERSEQVVENAVWFYNVLNHLLCY